ncbi:CIA30 family protein [Shewanella sp. JM162201]|uniref:CIA30 family protein n=2 Tax=Shewanella jiangmenensis TaxID=2837387 RepID=A0ABS5V771_9GAMM|nr:CIA30 family protein [Shewanella jiangmenensis]
MLLVDFSRADTPVRWYSINDGVMGGLSASSLRLSPEGFGVFCGHLSRENGGGFASVYLEFPPTDVSAFTGIEIELSMPQRSFKLNLKDRNCRDYLYQAALTMPAPLIRGGSGQANDDANEDINAAAFREKGAAEGGRWLRCRLPFAHFKAMRRGMPVQARALDLTALTELALVAAGAPEGDFSLRLRSIGLYRD